MKSGNYCCCCCYCCILSVLTTNIAITIILLVFDHTVKFTLSQGTGCTLQNLYNAFTIEDIQNIKQKDAILYNVLSTEMKFPSEPMLENYLRISKYRRKSMENRRGRLIVHNCSHQTNLCIKYIIKQREDYIMDPSNYYICYKRGQRIYRSTVEQFDRRSEFLFKIHIAKIQFIHLTKTFNLLFAEHNRSPRSAPLAIILSLVIGIPVILIVLIVGVIIAIHCCCKDSNSGATGDDELPQSLIENCKRAAPLPSEEGKYLPERIEATAFQFKGPLVIERPKFFILQHDLTDQRPTGSNMSEHVKFDENLNIAYDIGEDVEIIIKNYGSKTTTTTTTNREDEDDDDDDDDDQNETESRQPQSHGTIREKYPESTSQMKTPSNDNVPQKKKAETTKKPSATKKGSKSKSMATKSKSIQKTQESKTSEVLPPSKTPKAGKNSSPETKNQQREPKSQQQQHGGKSALPEKSPLFRKDTNGKKLVKSKSPARSSASTTLSVQKTQIQSVTLSPKPSKRSALSLLKKSPTKPEAANANRASTSNKNEPETSSQHTAAKTRSTTLSASSISQSKSQTEKSRKAQERKSDKE